MSPAPIEVWPLAHFLAEEMEERGWTAIDVARRMPGKYDENIFIINLHLCLTPEQAASLLLPMDQAIALGTAFDISGQMLVRLHQLYLDNPSARVPFECPQHLLCGLEFPSEH